MPAEVQHYEQVGQRDGKPVISMTQDQYFDHLNELCCFGSTALIIIENEKPEEPQPEPSPTPESPVETDTDKPQD